MSHQWYSNIRIARPNTTGLAPLYKTGNSHNLVFRNFIAGNNINIQIDQNGNIEISSNVSVSGSTTSGINLGSGQGVYAGMQGIDMRFRSLLAGSNITLLSGTNFIQISASNPGETNSASNVGSGVGAFLDKNGVDLRFKSFVGSGITVNDQGTTIGLTASAGSGEANNGSNLGTGERVFAGKTGVDLLFRSLRGTGSVSVLSGTNEITISASLGGGSGEVNTASNVGAGIGPFLDKNGVDLRFKSFVVGNGLSITDQGTTVGLTGTIETASNLGSGEGLFANKTGNDFQFRSLLAGTNITILSGTNFIQISSSAPIDNNGQNIGTGQGVYAGKSSTNLLFRSLVAGPNITINSGSNTIEISGTAGSGEVNTASNLGSGQGLFAQKSGVDLQFRSLIAGSNITLLSGTNFVQISASIAGGSGDVAGPASSTDNAIVRFDGTTGKTIQNSAATIDDSGHFDNAQGRINGRRHYGALGANPTNPAPASGDCYYNTGMQMEMMYDGTRGKWLSVESATFVFGASGTLNAGVFYRTAGFGFFSATRGYCMMYSGTIVGLGITRGDIDATVLEVLVNGTQYAFLSSSATASFNNSINRDFPGAVAGYTLSFRNQLLNGNQITDGNGWCRIKWRA